MFDRLILTQDVVDCRGEVIAARGLVLSRETIADAARRAPTRPRRPLEQTPLAPDVEATLGDPIYRHVFEGEGVRDAVRGALRGIALPDVLFEELVAVRRAGSPLHVHAFVTAAVAVRMLLAAVQRARGLAELAAAALLHDLGMHHMPPRTLRRRDRFGREDALRVTSHPFLGAYHLATVLGHHPAIEAAHSHHWRCGQGYPALPSAPSRATEVISVASAFAALTQPRPFRSSPYDARGASDVLVAEAIVGNADATTVKLLVHALRGGRGDRRGIRFGRERTGHGPDVNRYVRVTAPARPSV